MFSNLIRTLLLSILACALSPSPASSSPSLFSERYDIEIRLAVARWWPDYPYWLSWKAQLYQESRLDPSAVSPVGARGIAQFMPGTWADVSRALGYGLVSPHIASYAIEGGAWYMAQLRRTWSSPRPIEDRQRLAQASYNAGTGNLLRAQKLCGGALLYADIIPCLERVTGPRNAHETRTYVERIARWRLMLEAGR